MSRMIFKRYKSIYIHTKLVYGVFELQPTDFRLFLFPIIMWGRSRHLFGFIFHRWNNVKAVMGSALPYRAYFSISLLYFPSLDFRIGNGKNWFWIRNENYYGWKVHRQNVRNGF